MDRYTATAANPTSVADKMAATEALGARCPDCLTPYHGDRVSPEGFQYRTATPCPDVRQVTTNTEGESLWATRPIEAGRLSGVMPVMGARLFYGLSADRTEMVEYVMTGRGFATAEAKARAMTPTLLDTTWGTPTFEVDGRRLTARKVDLTPRETTGLALQWGRAMGLTR